MKNILVTGGAGYIGSHMVLELLKKGYNPIVIDNLQNSTKKNIIKIEEMTQKSIQFIEYDIKNDLSKLELPKIDAIVHFAALKAVGESVIKPLEYYENNVYGSTNLLKWARNSGVGKFIFSSTAAVYGNPPTEKVDENTITNPQSPYGRTKLMIEQIIKDSNIAFGLNSVILRYFNVAGNEENGLIGDLQSKPQNLFPAMIMSHLGYIDNKLKVYGNDYPTRDGTGIRDYIHLLDLIDAHIKSLEYLDKNQGSHIFNLGTSEGLSVLEVIQAFEKVTGEKLEYEIAPRRQGDITTIVTNSNHAKKELGWEVKRTLEEMISSMWKWYKNGYKA